ncbi:MAG TPA: VOC family protein [Stellaceae bacterium]|nr:VOC family protein [Stellaceae bacterium]
MGILGFDHVQLAMPKGGEPAARAFYGEVLGMRELPKPPELAARGGAWFSDGATQLHLGIDLDFRPAQRAHPALLVRGLDEYLARARERGIRIVDDEPLPGYRRAFLYDPFGNRLELMEKLA